MAGNKDRTRQENAQNIERHIELVQPRTLTAGAEPAAALAEKEQIREKIKVRAAGRKAMAEQGLKARAGGAGGKKKESRLIPAEGAAAGGMGMGMHVD
jgi:large subunit ribosomal protein L24e